jgi:hypothetical protein
MSDEYKTGEVYTLDPTQAIKLDDWLKQWCSTLAETHFIQEIDESR